MLTRTFPKLVSLTVAMVAGMASAAWSNHDAAIKLKDCPEAVQQTLKREATGGSIEEVEKKSEGDQVHYAAEIEIGDEDYDLEVLPNGTLLKKVLQVDDEDEDQNEDQDDGEEQDEEDAHQGEGEKGVKLEDCPTAVRKTLNREATGGSIEEIERKRDGDRVVYEAEIEIGGKDYEAEVLADGTLVKKTLDDDDNAGDENGDDDGDDDDSNDEE